MFANALTPMYFDNGKTCDFKGNLEDYYIQDYTKEWLAHNIELNNSFISGCIIYTNLFNNYKLINEIDNTLIISNNEKLWKGCDVLQYRSFYKLLKNNINFKDALKTKILILDNPSPNNNILKNLKTKFIIMFTSSICKSLFRIIINGYVSNGKINNMIYKYLLRKNNIKNDICSEIINIKSNEYDEIFDKINYINIYNIKKIKIFKEDFCPTCFDANPDIFFNCGHNFCLTCVKKIIKNDSCPMCRRKIKNNNSYNLYISSKRKSNKLKNINSFIKNHKTHNILFYTNDKFEEKYYITFFEKHNIIRKFSNINNNHFDFTIMNYIITSNIPVEDCNCLVNYLKETHLNFNINKIKFIKFIWI
tara:strand:- start:3758 stop:4846 length:1089 start_codon:yes stop_codon:yes gene_type:complete